jgi:hypothetical protein
MIRATWWQEVRSVLEILSHKKVEIGGTGQEVQDWRQQIEVALAARVALPTAEEWKAFQEQAAERIRRDEEHRQRLEVEFRRNQQERERQEAERRRVEQERREAEQRRAEQERLDAERRAHEAAERRQKQRAENACLDFIHTLEWVEQCLGIRDECIH